MHIEIVKNIEEADICTHAGIFHSDEVFATVMLGKVLKRWSPNKERLKVMRVTKVPENVNRYVKVVDIGGGELDHHQKGGNGVRANGVPYASCGLVWKEYGLTILFNTIDPSWVWEYIDSKLVQGIDARDNGIKTESDSFTISDAISAFNPTWDGLKGNEDECFIKAVEFAEQVLNNLMLNAMAMARARKEVERAIDGAYEHIMLIGKGVQWTELIFDSENPKAKEIYFAVSRSSRGGYNIQAVPDKKGSFGQRKPLPGAWRGLSGLELQKVTGVETATFCHSAGFICGAEKFDDALEMARLAINA